MLKLASDLQLKGNSIDFFKEPRPHETWSWSKNKKKLKSGLKYSTLCRFIKTQFDLWNFFFSFVKMQIVETLIGWCRNFTQLCPDLNSLSIAVSFYRTWSNLIEVPQKYVETPFTRPANQKLRVGSQLQHHNETADCYGCKINKNTGEIS